MVVGRTLILIGAALIVAGLIFVLASRVSWLGRLPGDIVVHRGGTAFHFPIVTSLLVSVILTVVLNVVLRLLWK
ncbi:MAG: DUF2905 domain-containing protein [Chloroflexi bacterium]|nr:DUF2905 domain-containing protein [Chloroflexota bacterium]